MDKDRNVIYVGDPMCSWCYGFANTIRALRDLFGARVGFRLVMGGLRPDGTHIADEHYTSFLRGHWAEVGQRTGQPFRFDILERTGWVYDTEKACRAVVAMRRIDPKAEWDYFAAAQKGFYHDNHDPNDPRSYARLAHAFGVSEAEFLAAYQDEAAIRETQQDFAWAGQVGVRSFPTVVLQDAKGLQALTVGYRPLEALQPLLAQWLEG